MIVKFSKTPFFLWSTFQREADSKIENENLLVQTKIKKLKFIPANRKFMFIKYLVVFILLFFTVSINEFTTLDLSVLLAPVLALIVYLYRKYWKAIIALSIIPIVSFFYYINILHLPYFIKYFVITFVLLEFYFDLFKRDHYEVFEIAEINEGGEELENNEDKGIVSFASVNKNQLKEKN